MVLKFAKFLRERVSDRQRVGSHLALPTYDYKSLKKIDT